MTTVSAAAGVHEAPVADVAVAAGQRAVEGRGIQAGAFHLDQDTGVERRAFGIVVPHAVAASRHVPSSITSRGDALVHATALATFDRISPIAFE